MSQPLDLICPHCAQHLKVAGATAGKQVRCPKCHGFVRVPESGRTPDQGGFNTATSGNPPRSETHRWLVRTEDGRVYGPVPRSEIEQWIREGRVTEQCHLAAEGTEQWRWAGELFPQLVQPPRGPLTSSPQPQPYSSYGYGAYPAGPVSDKSRLIAGLLGLLLPLVGIHGVQRLYTGHILLGVLMMITCGGCYIWQLIDVILIFAGSVTDADGRPLRD